MSLLLILTHSSGSQHPTDESKSSIFSLVIIFWAACLHGSEPIDLFFFQHFVTEGGMQERMKEQKKQWGKQ